MFTARIYLADAAADRPAVWTFPTAQAALDFVKTALSRPYDTAAIPELGKAFYLRPGLGTDPAELRTIDLFATDDFLTDPAGPEPAPRPKPSPPAYHPHPAATDWLAASHPQEKEEA